MNSIDSATIPADPDPILPNPRSEGNIGTASGDHETVSESGPRPDA
jgi:hypothetical protein